MISHTSIIGEPPPLSFLSQAYSRHGRIHCNYQTSPSLPENEPEAEEMKVLTVQDYNHFPSPDDPSPKIVPAAAEVVILPPERDFPAQTSQNNAQNSEQQTKAIAGVSETEPDDENLEGFMWDDQSGSATYMGVNAWHIPSSITVKFAPKIRKLDLSFNCLQTLAGIEFFNSLEELILDNNLLDDSVRFFYNPQMKTLSINKNKITDLERFLNEISLKLPSLSYLSLLGNPACPDQLSSSEHDEADYRRYRSYVVHRISTLKFLDSGPIRPAEREDAQRSGRHYRLVRLNSDSFVEKDRQRVKESFLQRSNTDAFTPLPYDHGNTTARAAYGRLRHRYTGKHSEGNRFIRNHEL